MNDQAIRPVVKKPIPSKLKQDAIVEAIFEIRFDTTTIAEILFGRLADFAPWKGFQQRRLPAYDIPDPMRQIDLNLRYAPVFELQDEAAHRAIRIGAHVLSYHQLSPYVGWDKLKPELLKAVEIVFARADKLVVRRLGLRYINALRTDIHQIASISQLDLKIAVADESLTGKVNLNFITALSDDDSCTVRVATADFTQGNLPDTTSLVVDVDVSTREGLRNKSEAETTNWLEFAHTHEKEQFFRLLTHDTIRALKEA